MDRQHLNLPAAQVSLLHAVAAANPRVVVVLSAGSVVELSWSHLAPGILHSYLSGQAGAEGVVDVLTGAANPSGKLVTPMADTLESSGEFGTPVVLDATQIPPRQRSGPPRQSRFLGATAAFLACDVYSPEKIAQARRNLRWRGRGGSQLLSMT